MQSMHSRDSYTATAIALHWLIALLVLGQFVFGLQLDSIAPGTPARGFYLNLHKSTGILIGLLVLLRFGWRLPIRRPPCPPQYRPGNASLPGSIMPFYTCACCFCRYPVILRPISVSTGSSFSIRCPCPPGGRTIKAGIGCLTIPTTLPR